TGAHAELHGLRAAASGRHARHRRAAGRERGGRRPVRRQGAGGIRSDRDVRRGGQCHPRRDGAALPRAADHAGAGSRGPRGEGGTMSELLAGTRVLDLSRMLAGPYGSMLLADMGAEVIKVEDPDGGDPMRAMGPPFLPDGESAYFLAINRNKRSVALDLTRPAGRGVFMDLVAQADVVWENFRPGVMDRLGLGYPALSGVNPRLVICSLS